MSESGERLQKVLARVGVGSRRAIEDLIAAGRVTVNGHRARLGVRIASANDIVEIDGSRVPLRVDLAHYLLNKPAGVVTTTSDPEGRPTVLEIADLPVRLWPVGRLDVGTEGALVLTNDGELTNRLTHPRYEVPKTYLVEVRGGIGQAALRALARGVPLEDGMARPARARLLERTAGAALVELAIAEGRNRQVRRMFESLDCRVGRLVRTAIGPLMLGHLKPGAVRKLSLDEVRELYRVCGL